MMKNIYTIAGTLLLLGAVLSCTREKALEPEQAGQMRFAVTVEGTTKASMTSADLGQFYLKVTGPNNAFSFFDTIVKEGETWKASSKRLLWKDEESSITYAAASYGALGADYFNIPVTNDLFTSGATMGLLTDQSTQAKLNAADLLTMKENTLAFADTEDGIVPVTLKHGLAKVNFQLTLAAEYFDNGVGLEASPITGLALSGVHTSFFFSPLAGEVSIGASKGAVIPFQSSYEPGTEAAKPALAVAEAILVPEAFAAGALTLYFSVNGKDFQWTNSEALTFKQGGEYTVPVTIDYPASPVTPDPGPTPDPATVLPGVFSVSAVKTVQFSKGNLRYASGAWSFFDNQYDYYATYSADAWDKFGWSNATNNFGMSTSTDNTGYKGDLVDWGTVPGIGTGWRTLTKDEWYYLFNTRTNAASKYGYATVGALPGIHGIIIVPDEFTDPKKNNGFGVFVGSGTTGWSTNYYSAEHWALMEAAGAVFLPATGYRQGTSVQGAGESCSYRSSSRPNDVSVNYVYFTSSSLNASTTNYGYYGQCIRLVCDATAADPADPTGPTAYTLAESTVGMIVGTDGKAYAVADKDNLPSGVTAVAMVAYKSGSNGLAIQLNGSPVKMKWADAKTYAEGLTEVSGGTWRLPSRADWQNMFVGCAVSGDATVPDANDEMNPIAGFKAKIAASGITWQSSTYWSSTESGSGAWLVGVNLDGSDARATFIGGPAILQLYVRACLAF